jgi:glutathione S-transferase
MYVWMYFKLGLLVVQIFSPLMATFAMKDPQEKIAARKALIQPDGAATKKMALVEALVSANTNAFYCGPEASLADVHLFCFLGTLRSGCVLPAASQ